MCLTAPFPPCPLQVVFYFAPQFAELRRRMVQGGERVFVASLARCVRWAQRGGKSNAYFAKTRDDRFIIKQMSKVRGGEGASNVLQGLGMIACYARPR